MATIPIRYIHPENSTKNAPARFRATAIKFITRNTSMIELSLISFNLVITRDSE